MRNSDRGRFAGTRNGILDQTQWRETISHWPFGGVTVRCVLMAAGAILPVWEFTTE